MQYIYGAVQNKGTEHQFGHIKWLAVSYRVAAKLCVLLTAPQ
jgi:hypothetical protein